MQKLIDESMIDICKEERVSSEQVFFFLFFAVSFIVMGYLNIMFYVRRTAYVNTRVYF